MVPVIIGSVVAVPVIADSVVTVPAIMESIVMVAVTNPLRPAKAALTESRAVTASPMVRVYTDG